MQKQTLVASDSPETVSGICKCCTKSLQGDADAHWGFCFDCILDLLTSPSPYIGAWTENDLVELLGATQG